MAQCRFHANSDAVSYCPACRAMLCQRCGAPGNPCSLCRSSALARIPAGGLPEPEVRMPPCAAHPDRSAGKACHDCGTPRCQACLNWQGICRDCAPKYPTASSAVEPDPESETAPRRLKRRKEASPDLSYTGGLNRHKGWQRRLVRLVIGAALLGGVGWALSFQYGVFKDFATMAGTTRQKLQGVQGLAGGGRQADMASMMQRLESGEVTEADVAETERLMARIEGGDAVDTGQREALTKLSRLYQQQSESGGAMDPQAKKMWALLSEWSNDQEADAGSADPASLARPVARVPRSRPTPPPAVPWKVAMLAPANGARVQGMVTVSARIEGQGYIDRVEFLVNGEWQGLSNRPPFRFDWDTTGSSNGAKTLEVVAYEPSGTRHASRRVKVTVAN